MFSLPHLVAILLCFVFWLTQASCFEKRNFIPICYQVFLTIVHLFSYLFIAALFFLITRSTTLEVGSGDQGKSTDSALSSDETGPSSSDITPSSETSLSDLALGSEIRPSASTRDRSTSRQLTQLAQLVQEHYAYAATDVEAGNTDLGH